MNEQIREAAYKAARGEIEVPEASGYCLSFVRRVVEAHALFGGRVVSSTTATSSPKRRCVPARTSGNALKLTRGPTTSPRR